MAGSAVPAIEVAGRPVTARVVAVAGTTVRVAVAVPGVVQSVVSVAVMVYEAFPPPSFIAAVAVHTPLVEQVAPGIVEPEAYTAPPRSMATADAIEYVTFPICAAVPRLPVKRGWNVALEPAVIVMAVGVIPAV
jgi:hypothetical protein